MKIGRLLWLGGIFLGFSRLAFAVDGGLTVPVTVVFGGSGNPSKPSAADVEAIVMLADKSTSYFNSSTVGFQKRINAAPLIPGKTYQLQVSSAWVNNFYARLIPPAGYTIQIDTVNQLYVSGPASSATFDQEYEVVVRPARGSDALRAGDASALSSGKVAWRMGLGTLRNGESAGFLALADDGSAVDWTNLAKPGALFYTTPSEEVQVYAPSGVLRQIYANQALVDITEASGTTIIAVYNAKDLSGSGFPYSATGDFYVKYIISKSDTTALKIDKYLDGTSTVAMTTEVAKTTSGWVRDDWHTPSTDPENTDTRTSSTSSGIRTEVSAITGTEMLAGSPKVVRKTETQYQDFGWGEQIIQTTDGKDEVDLTTNYSYYTTTPTSSSYGQLKSIVRPGGAWEAYDYYSTNAYDSGMVNHIYRPVADSPGTPSFNTSSGTVVTYDYAADWTQVKRRPSSVITTVAGTTTAKATIDYTSTTANGATVVIATRKDYASSGSADYLTTISKFYQENAPDPLLRGQPWSVERPDGTKDVFQYLYGTLSGTTFSADASLPGNTAGKAFQVAVFHGITGAGTACVPGGYQTVDSVNLVTNRSTKDVAIRDQYGLLRRRETYVWNGSAFAIVDSVDYSYDNANQPTGTEAMNGAATSASYTGDRRMSETDAQGIVTGYTYDSAGRVHTATKEGASAYTYATGVVFAAQPAIVTTLTYDAAGAVTKTEVSSAGTMEKIVTSAAFDTAGRLKSKTVPGAGTGVTYTTSYSYPNNGRDVQITNSDTGTRIETYHLDGSLASVTGTAQVNVAYDYGTDGHTFTQNAGPHPGPYIWSQQITDWLGRPTANSTHGPNNATLTTSLHYNGAGQLDKKTAPGQSPTLFAYDAFGRLEYTALDAAHADVIDAGGTDRVSRVQTTFDSHDGGWWAVRTESIYATDNSATATVLAKTEARLSGFATGVRAETWSWDANNNLTKQTTEVADKVVTIVTTLPDSNTREACSYNGLPVYARDQFGVATRVSYDDLGRKSLEKAQRTTGVVTTYYPGSALVATTQFDGGGALIASFGYDNAGRVNSRTTPWVDPVTGTDSTAITYYEYSKRGELLHQWGNGAYPVAYAYDDYGRLYTQTTYRGQQAAWAGSTWPTGVGTPDTTTLEYYPTTSFLQTKTYPDSHTLSFTYDSAGRTYTRTDGRGVVTTYGYSPTTGELTSQTYSDTTPSVSYTYKRTGAVGTATQDGTVTQTWTYHYRSDLQLDYEDLPAFYNAGATSRRLTYTYETASGAVGRPTGFGLGTAGSPTSLQTVSYGFDDYGRVQTIGGHGSGLTNYSFTYGYHPDAGWLVTSVTNTASGYAQGRSYDSDRDVISQAQTLCGSTVLASYDYTFYANGQRRTAKQAGTSGTAFADLGADTFYRYGYNARGELVSAPGFLGADVTSPSAPALSSRMHAYEYDDAGNRTAANRTGVPALKESYTPGPGNRLDARENKTVSVQGTVKENSTVMAAGSTASVAGVQGRYWGTEVTLDNASGPAYAAVNVYSAAAGGASPRAQTSATAFLAAANETLGYDENGNLTSDGRWTYTWDAENRLVQMMSTTLAKALPGFPGRRLTFSYDYLGRRIGKTVESWSGSAWTGGTETRYVYQGWNVVAEMTSAGAVGRHFLWGLDLSGTVAGAGGVGGLLAIQDGGETYLPGYDGNGNVAVLMKASTGDIAAAYEYSPFGTLLRSKGSYAAGNPFRFSTKWWDAESGLAYYGYRYYSPETGRFINRDPIGEGGGLNLYGFCQNSPVDGFDMLGMLPKKTRERAIQGAFNFALRAVLKNNKGYDTGGSDDQSRQDLLGGQSPALPAGPYVDSDEMDSAMAGTGGSGITSAIIIVTDKKGNKTVYRVDSNGNIKTAPAWMAGDAIAQSTNATSSNSFLSFDARTDAQKLADAQQAFSEAPNSVFLSPGIVTPAPVNNPASGTTITVNGYGTLTVGNYQSYTSGPEDGAPNGVTHAKLSMSFTPTNGTAATNYVWVQWVTSDPLNSSKGSPYLDSYAPSGTYNDNFPSGKYNNGTPVYSGGNLNFYDHPQNPVGSPVNFSTFLIDKNTGTILQQVNWTLPPNG